MESIETGDFHDYIKGCLFGAFVGDSAGAFFEFNNSLATEEKCRQAILLRLCNYEMGPGQGTDDTEMALSLAYGLMATQEALDLNAIIKFYGKWIQSHPFDTGSTTRKALFHANPKNPDYQKVKLASEKRNQNSESNGGLMRISPLAIYCRNLDSALEKGEFADFEKAIIAEQSITHPKKIVHECAISYCLAIKTLINSKGNRKLALERTKKWIFTYSKCDELKAWWKGLDNEREFEVPPVGKVCWMKIGWKFAFHCLRKNLNYHDSLLYTLLKKGDTDTNCAIVGAMIGSANGFLDIPSESISRILSYDYQSSKLGTKRPDWLNTGKNINEILQFLIEKAPNTLNMVP